MKRSVPLNKGGSVIFRKTIAHGLIAAMTFCAAQTVSAQTLTELDIVRATASSDDGNVPANAIDGLLSTRWSASGSGQYLTLDLSTVRDLGSISIVFYKGSERRNKFELALSSDGVNFTKYGATLTSALSSRAQKFSLNGRARFIRYVGYGNDSANSASWNSLSEVAIFAPAVAPAPSPTPFPTTGANLFESFDTSTKTTFGTAVINHRNVELAPGKGVGGTSAIKVLYVGNSEGSERVLVSHRIPRSKEYTLNFDVNFCSGYDFAKGGKLHGLGPMRPVAGGNSVGDDQWSARGMWNSRGGINTYTYNQNMRSQYGDAHASSGFVFQAGKYHAVSYHVRVNDPASSANGFMRIYVDGVERVRQDNIQFRSIANADTEINTLMFNTFFGGHTAEWAPRNPDGSYKLECAYFDNFAAYPFMKVRKAPGQ